MAKILGKMHKPKVLGADTHSVSLICEKGEHGAAKGIFYERILSMNCTYYVT